MKESNPESKKTSEISQSIDSTKIDTPEDNTIIEKPQKKRNKSEKNASKENTSQEQKKPLLNEIDDQKTRILQRDPPPRTSRRRRLGTREQTSAFKFATGSGGQIPFGSMLVGSRPTRD